MKTTVQPTFVLELTRDEIELLYWTIHIATDEVPEKFQERDFDEVRGMMRQMQATWQSSDKKDADNVSEV